MNETIRQKAFRIALVVLLCGWLSAWYCANHTGLAWYVGFLGGCVLSWILVSPIKFFQVAWKVLCNMSGGLASKVLLTWQRKWHGVLGFITGFQASFIFMSVVWLLCCSSNIPISGYWNGVAVFLPIYLFFASAAALAVLYGDEEMDGSLLVGSDDDGMSLKSVWTTFLWTNPIYLTYRLIRALPAIAYGITVALIYALVWSAFGLFKVGQYVWFVIKLTHCNERMVATVYCGLSAFIGSHFTDPLLAGCIGSTLAWGTYRYVHSHGHCPAHVRVGSR